MIAIRRTTQALLLVTGVAVFAIGLAHLILSGAAVNGGSPLNATARGEHRSFTALFACYGLAFLWCVPAVKTKTRQINLLAAPFLAVGLARLLSIAMSGPLPEILFFVSSRLPQSF